MYKVHVRRTVIFAVIGVLAGLAVFLFSPRIYEARLEMLLGSNYEGRTPTVVFDAEVQKILDRNAPQGVQTERQLLNSESVYQQALASAAPDLMEHFEELYLMYDVITPRTPNQNEVGAGIAMVRVRTHDREEAINIANAIEDAYNSTRQKAAKESNAAAVEYLQAQITSTDKELADAEAEYQKYKEDTKIAALDRRMIEDTTQEAALRNAIEANKADLDRLDKTIEQSLALIATVPKTVPDSNSEVRHPLVDRLETEVQNLISQRAALLAQYTESNPKVKVVDEALRSAQAELAEAKKDPTAMGYSNVRKNPVLTQLESLVAGSKTERAGVIGRLDGLQRSLDEHDLRLAETPAMEVRLSELQRDRMIFDEKYRRLKSQLEELLNRGQTETPFAVVLGEQGAIASQRPVAPDAVKLTFIGFIAGACIGLVFSFALEALRPRVYTSGQLADLTGLPVVASVPTLPGLTRTRAVENLAKPGGRVMESFRNMAYTYLAAGAAQGQTVLFTGIGTSGSSSIGAAQFAVALARAGTKVVLVDAERTRQVITNGFGATDKKGASNALRDGSDPTTMLIDTVYENLRVLPLGTVPEAMVAEAGPDRVDAMIARLRQGAQVVVVAVAPTDVLADAAAFASRVDEVCLSVSARSNEYGSVPTAYDILDKAGARSIKLILTDTGKDSEPFSTSVSTSIQRTV